jgi:cytidyltransferase-like protein
MSRAATMQHRLVVRNLRGKPRVMVSGCFDLLHSGHIAFLEEAAALGRLTVAIGSDKTILKLKGKPPVNCEQERLYIVKSLRCVEEAFISSGSGMFDFLPELNRVSPDIFFVNADGDSAAKRQAIERAGVRYTVSRRIPSEGLPHRSTTVMREICTLPFRLDLAGGWLDQPFVSKYFPGPVINCCLEPSEEYQTRSGLASSTRAAGIRLWGPKLPAGDRESLAKMLFACENPPGTVDVSGSQDAIGVVFPGVNRLDYRGEYWPEKITPNLEPGVIDFLEAHVQLIATDPRGASVQVLKETRIDRDGAQRLAEAAEECWEAMLAMNARAFGRAMTESFEAQVAMFPGMVNEEILQTIEKHRGDVLGWKIAGAGGGGYVVVVSEEEIEGAGRVRIQREA